MEFEFQKYWFLVKHAALSEGSVRQEEKSFGFQIKIGKTRAKNKSRISRSFHLISEEEIDVDMVKIHMLHLIPESGRAA